MHPVRCENAVSMRQLMDSLLAEANELPAHEAFTALAPYYDELMAEVPYSSWVDYILEILRRLKYRFRTVLDLACGTGNVAYEFARRGYSATGVDKSAAMIKEAKRKAQLHPDLKLRFYCQDISA
ncbi:MAG TPA: class I SAM-dependent methyltransferase, partial [Armatimonadetes bacterium]|nr:class I SAM-dependent methyltransferase [Armatimonadota bacterium]